jgi:diacylglycerol kinase
MLQGQRSLCETTESAKSLRPLVRHLILATLYLTISWWVGLGEFDWAWLVGLCFAVVVVNLAICAVIGRIVLESWRLGAGISQGALLLASLPTAFGRVEFMPKFQ